MAAVAPRLFPPHFRYRVDYSTGSTEWTITQSDVYLCSARFNDPNRLSLYHTTFRRLEELFRKGIPVIAYMTLHPNWGFGVVDNVKKHQGETWDPMDNKFWVQVLKRGELSEKERQKTFTIRQIGWTSSLRCTRGYLRTVGDIADHWPHARVHSLGIDYNIPTIYQDY